MLDHLGFGVSDVATSKAFFTAALAPLGYTAVMTTARRACGRTITRTTTRRS